MTHTVQFIHLDDFVADCDNGIVSGIYHELIEQRIGSNDHGLSRWQMATIIRALISPHPRRTQGTIDHTASLTIPHGAPVTRLAGRNFDPDTDDAERWRTGREQHTAIIDHLRDTLTPLDSTLILSGVLDVPNDTILVYAAHPLADLAEDTAADYTPEGGAGSPD